MSHCRHLFRFVLLCGFLHLFLLITLRISSIIILYFRRFVIFIFVPISFIRLSTGRRLSSSIITLTMWYLFDSFWSFLLCKGSEMGLFVLFTYFIFLSFICSGIHCHCRIGTWWICLNSWKLFGLLVKMVRTWWSLNSLSDRVVFQILFIHILVSPTTILKLIWTLLLNIFTWTVSSAASYVVTQSIHVRVVRWIDNLTEVSLSFHFLGLRLEVHVHLLLLDLLLTVLWQLIKTSTWSTKDLRLAITLLLLLWIAVLIRVVHLLLTLVRPRGTLIGIAWLIAINWLPDLAGVGWSIIRWPYKIRNIPSWVIVLCGRRPLVPCKIQLVLTTQFLLLAVVRGSFGDRLRIWIGFSLCSAIVPTGAIMAETRIIVDLGLNSNLARGWLLLCLLLLLIFGLTSLWPSSWSDQQRTTLRHLNRTSSSISHQMRVMVLVWGLLNSIDIVLKLLTVSEFSLHAWIRSRFILDIFLTVLFECLIDGISLSGIVGFGLFGWFYIHIIPPSIVSRCVLRQSRICSHADIHLARSELTVLVSSTKLRPTTDVILHQPSVFLFKFGRKVATFNVWIAPRVVVSELDAVAGACCGVRSDLLLLIGACDPVVVQLKVGLFGRSYIFISMDSMLDSLTTGT